MPVDQVPGNGEFLLYPNIPPMLLAGSYTLNATQDITANGRTSAQLPVDELDVHLEVRSPRLVLPPDQVLSTFPPAESEGAYGSRLPQVVIRRRTLPWERQVAGAPARSPWLALVVIAEGEAALIPNVPAASTVTAGVTLAGALDTDIGNCLEIRQSMVNTIFPTRKDVPLLAHARHVDINDTELMMGDDDGFLAVVVANRLPMSTRDASNAEVPVKYTACLVNLEGQWEALLPTAPPPSLISAYLGLEHRVQLQAAAMDKHVMGGAVDIENVNIAHIDQAVHTNVSTPIVRDAPGPGDSARVARAAASTDTARIIADPVHDTVSASVANVTVGYSAPKSAHATSRAESASAFATDRVYVTGILATLDPLLRFPVLLHWRFTTTGTATFESLMRNLDSGLMGTVAQHAPPSDAGRLPLELVDTGHVGIEQKTRRGDSVRAWYRGPFVPHPTDDSLAKRLPLAHAADQLRIVIPDGREDLSLASAFEIGRLLALANPNMVAALLRWRQLHYATVRRTSIWQSNAALLDALAGFTVKGRVGLSAAVDLSRALMRSVSEQPAQLLGGPRAVADPGRAVDVGDTLREIVGGALGGGDVNATSKDAATLMSAAFGLPTLRGDATKVLATLQQIPVRVANITEKVGDVPGSMFSKADAAALARTLDLRVQRLSAQSTTKAQRSPADALDAVITRMSARDGMIDRPEEDA